jgi:hypothetical protein
MAYERLLDATTTPTPAQVRAHLGSSAGLYDSLLEFLSHNYQVEPLVEFGGAKYGWQLRYRKGSKPLCTIYPEAGAFTVLVVLGRDESDKALAAQDTLHPTFRKALLEAHVYHDGRWLWLRVLSEEDLEDIKTLLAIKRKPKPAA